MNTRHREVIGTLSSLIESGKISGAVSFSEIEASILEVSTGAIGPFQEDLKQEVRAYLDGRYQVMISNNDADTIMWRISQPEQRMS